MRQKGSGKSDGSIVPEKLGNKASLEAADRVEERGPAKKKSLRPRKPRTQRRTLSLKERLERLGETARRDKSVKFTSLMHHVYDVGCLREAFFSLRPEASAGVDGVTWSAYAEDLESRLADLSDRVARGGYRPAPVRRTFIPKAGGKRRPLGVPTLEDKIVQAAMTKVLSAIYECHFLGFSYGFRTGRSPHQALDALYVAIERRKVNYVLDADIRGFFDSIDHDWLIRFIEHRIGDRRVVRLIQKWLRAGVLEDGQVHRSGRGTPQGGIISPLLANIYLHHVLDQWVHQWRKAADGDVIVVRYADDFVVGFQHESDARRFWTELEARLERFGLALHPEKTRLVEFGRYAAERRKRKGQRRPETFDFLGFTHFCSQTRSGEFRVGRRTARKRLISKAKEVRAELFRRRHDPISEVGQWLGAVVQGHEAYFAIPGNRSALAAFRKRVLAAWRAALSRRSQKGRVTAGRVRRLWRRFVPGIRIRHPWPSFRFDRWIRGRSPVR